MGSRQQGQRHLWSRAKKDITADAVQRVLQANQPRLHQPPLAHSHNRVEGSTEYTQLLYIPAKAPMDLYNRDKAVASSCM